MSSDQRPKSGGLIQRHAGKICFGVIVICGLLGLVALRLVEPTADSWFPKCTFHQVTGLHCPGCGATRAVRALVMGDIVLAIRNNPLLIIGLPIMLVVIYVQRRRERLGGLAAPKIAITFFVIVVAYFIARNVPSPTRSWLAPVPSRSTDSPPETDLDLQSRT